MLFQRKIDRAFKKLHEESDHPEIDHFAKERKMGKMKMEDPEERRARESLSSEEYEMPELEKNDFLAMVLAALLTILPVALIVLLVIALAGYFLFM